VLSGNRRSAAGGNRTRRSKLDGTLLTEGYIAIQGESHPTEFRKIEVLNLSGCMDPKSPKYKSYYVHQGEGACR
jgi:hypothetical protein